MPLGNREGALAALMQTVSQETCHDCIGNKAFPGSEKLLLMS